MDKRREILKETEEQSRLTSNESCYKDGDEEKKDRG